VSETEKPKALHSKSRNYADSRPEAHLAQALSTQEKQRKYCDDVIQSKNFPDDFNEKMKEAFNKFSFFITITEDRYNFWRLSRAIISGCVDKIVRDLGERRAMKAIRALLRDLYTANLLSIDPNRVFRRVKLAWVRRGTKYRKELRLPKVAPTGGFQLDGKKNRHSLSRDL
jgi:hypothetical protein